MTSLPSKRVSPTTDGALAAPPGDPKGPTATDSEQTKDLKPEEDDGTGADAANSTPSPRPDYLGNWAEEADVIDREHFSISATGKLVMHRKVSASEMECEERCCPGFWKDNGVPPVPVLRWVFDPKNKYLNNNDCA